MGSALVKVAAVVSSVLLVGGLVSYRAGAFDRWTQPAAPAGPAPGDELLSNTQEPVAAESFIYSTKSAPIFVDPGSPPESSVQPAIADVNNKAVPVTRAPSPSEVQRLQGGSKSKAVFGTHDVPSVSTDAAEPPAVQPAAPAANTQNNAAPRRIIMSSSKSIVLEANPPPVQQPAAQQLQQTNNQGPRP